MAVAMMAGRLGYLETNLTVPSWVNSELGNWGNWYCNRIFHERGWPSENHICAETFELMLVHRILAPERPKRIRSIDIAVSQIPPELGDVLKAKFWCYRDGFGRVLTNAEKGSWFDRGKGWFEERVRRGKFLVWQGLIS